MLIYQSIKYVLHMWNIDKGVCGALAGIIYGNDGIPKDWYQLLQNKEYLLKMINEYDMALIKF